MNQSQPYVRTDVELAHQAAYETREASRHLAALIELEEKCERLRALVKATRDERDALRAELDVLRARLARVEQPARDFYAMQVAPGGSFEALRDVGKEKPSR